MSNTVRKGNVSHDNALNLRRRGQCIRLPLQKTLYVKFSSTENDVIKQDIRDIKIYFEVVLTC